MLCIYSVKKLINENKNYINADIYVWTDLGSFNRSHFKIEHGILKNVQPCHLEYATVLSSKTF